MVHYPDQIEYSEKYQDEVYEYRHVIMTEKHKKLLSNGKLLSESEWRNLGIQQSKGWEHFLIYKKEPHILIFRRPIGTDPLTGFISDDIKKNIEEYEILKNKIIYSDKE